MIPILITNFKFHQYSISSLFSLLYTPHTQGVFVLDNRLSLNHNLTLLLPMPEVEASSQDHDLSGPVNLLAS